MTAKNTIPAILLCLLMGTFSSCNPPAVTNENSFYANLPFDMEPVERPSIPDRSVTLTDFGGVGNGDYLNTDAFAKAIAHLSSQGGGRLDVPQGVWHTGPIALESNIELHLDDNAIIVFSTNKDLYPLVYTIFEGQNTYRCHSPIYAVDKKNIAITGKGIIDGNGDAWRAVKKDKVNENEWEELLDRGGVVSENGKDWYPSESFRRGAQNSDQNVSKWATTIEDFESIRDFLRPVLVSIVNCENVLLDGPVFQNSPCWTIHPALCTNLIVNDITVRCPWYAQNGDGIDIESCDRVLLTNSSFDVGDDGICIKSGKNEEGRKRGVPCSNVIVDNCTVFHGHGGFVVGSEMSGGVKNISVSNCRFSGTDVGLRFKSTRGRGGVVEGIYIKDITMNDIITEALLFDLFYGGKSAVEAREDGEAFTDSDLPMVAVDETTPQFKDIHISNVQCRNANRAMLFNGLPEMNVSNVRVENCSIHAQTGAQINESDGVLLMNLEIIPESGPALMFNNVKNVCLDEFKTNKLTPQTVYITGTRNQNIYFTKCALTNDNIFTQDPLQRNQVSVK